MNIKRSQLVTKGYLPNTFTEQKISNAQLLATRYTEAKIDAAVKDFLSVTDEKAIDRLDDKLVNGAMFKALLGRHIAKAYALGYVDGWEKNEPKKIYV